MTTRRTIAIFCFAISNALAAANPSWASHCDYNFVTDIGPTMGAPTGQPQQATGDCSGSSGCNDYFDITLRAGDRVTVTTASSTGFTPEYSAWSGPPQYFALRSCGFSLDFVAPFDDTFRVRIGGFGSTRGTYAFTYTAPASSTIAGAIPLCFAVDAKDDRFDVINDGSTADLDVLRNDECRGDPPVSVNPQPGDLDPDRGGAATTDGNTILYTPATGFIGFEEFDYTAEDAGLEGGDDPPNADQDRARVVVTVIEDLQPDAVDDELTMNQDQTVFIDVLQNDFLANDPIVLEVASDPAHGSALVQADQAIRYRPNFNFFGEDSFEYRIIDANGDVDVAVVTIGVHFVRGVVPIDVIPNDAGNNLNLKGGPGSGFRVAILSVGEFFDAPSQIDPLSLKLGPRGANIFGDAVIRDVDRDGDDDLLVKFLTQQTGIACGDSHVSLSGRTFSSQSISGQDAINTFSCPRVRKRY